MDSGGTNCIIDMETCSLPWEVQKSVPGVPRKLPGRKVSCASYTNGWGFLVQFIWSHMKDIAAAALFGLKESINPTQ